MQNGRLLSLKLETADAAADKMGLGKPGNEEGAIPLEESCVLEFPNVLEATAAGFLFHVWHLPLIPIPLFSFTVFLTVSWDDSVDDPLPEGVPVSSSGRDAGTSSS